MIQKKTSIQKHKKCVCFLFVKYLKLSVLFINKLEFHLNTRINTEFHLNYEVLKHKLFLTLKLSDSSSLIDKKDCL